jgi:hypothetical protein
MVLRENKSGGSRAVSRMRKSSHIDEFVATTVEKMLSAA